jgi:adenylosuccinate lyase
MNLQIKRSLDLIRPAFKALLHSLHKRSVEMKDIMTIGRSHGMYAEPMSFGQKLLGFYNEFSRHYKAWETWYDENLTIQFSGAVGNYTILTPEQEEKAAESLRMKVEPLSTQVIPRDRLASLISIHALIASAMERFCVEIRHLHRSDVAELHEGFKKGQKGSSTMPHKKNPISGENLTGMARVLRSHVHMALENIVLWHERDISHSSTERLYLPDNLGLMLYSLERLTDTVDNLVFHHEVIENRVFEQHNYLSSYYLHQLLKQTDVKREELYYFVQEAAFKSQSEPEATAFHRELVTICKDKNITVDLTTPTKEELKNIYLGSTDQVFHRSLEQYPLP